MLTTPLGEMEILIDGAPVIYDVRELPNNEAVFPDVDGRFVSWWITFRMGKVTKSPAE